MHGLQVSPMLTLLSQITTHVLFFGEHMYMCESIRYRTNISKSPTISTTFKLTLASEHGQTGGSLKPIMTNIAKYLGVNLYTSKSETYIVQVESRASFDSVINYFSVYPLFSYKHFNYITCVKVHNLLINKKHLTQEGQVSIINLKDQLKDKTNFSDWSHLDHFYS